MSKPTMMHKLITDTTHVETEPNVTCDVSGCERMGGVSIGSTTDEMTNNTIPPDN